MNGAARQTCGLGKRRPQRLSRNNLSSLSAPSRAPVGAVDDELRKAVEPGKLKGGGVSQQRVSRSLEAGEGVEPDGTDGQAAAEHVEHL